MNKKPQGFAARPDLAKEANAKGGRNSKGISKTSGFAVTNNASEMAKLSWKKRRERAANALLEKKGGNDQINKQKSDRASV